MQAGRLRYNQERALLRHYKLKISRYGEFTVIKPLFPVWAQHKECRRDACMTAGRMPALQKKYEVYKSHNEDGKVVIFSVLIPPQIIALQAISTDAIPLFRRDAMHCVSTTGNPACGVTRATAYGGA